MVAMLTENEEPAVLQRVVAAARRCFARYGVDRTTMQDIAKESGIGRTGVYRLGLTRPEITEAAIVTRLRELGEGIRPIADRDAPFVELLLETSIATVRPGSPQHGAQDIQNDALHGGFVAGDQPVQGNRCGGVQ